MSGAILLLSGGIDSAALAFWKKPSAAFTIDYGQVSAAGEIRASSQIAKELGIHHEVIRVDCHSLGSGDLAATPAHPEAPASEWWPYRNQLLITLAAMKAISIGANRLIVGTVKTDSFHADGTSLFYEHLDRLLSIQEGSLRVETPAIHITSAELVRQSGIPAPIIGWTHSCHKSPYSCGSCRGCWKHQSVLHELELD